MKKTNYRIYYPGGKFECCSISLQRAIAFFKSHHPIKSIEQIWLIDGNGNWYRIPDGNWRKIKIKPNVLSFQGSIAA